MVPCPDLLGDAVRRREFIKVLVGSAAAWPLAVRAQQPERMRRIGVLLPATADDAAMQARVGALLQGLALLGWTIGRNVRGYDLVPLRSTCSGLIRRPTQRTDRYDGRSTTRYREPWH